MLEETGLPYQLIIVDISKGEQFESRFLKISPNNKVPAIIDKDALGGEPMSLFESGAILQYFTEKTGQFLPKIPCHRWDARLYGVLDRKIGDKDFVASDAYSITDMAIFPWCRQHERQEQDLNDFPNVKRWFDVIARRPAVARDIKAASEDIVEGFTPESWAAVSFGSDQYQKR